MNCHCCLCQQIDTGLHRDIETSYWQKTLKNHLKMESYFSGSSVTKWACQYEWLVAYIPIAQTGVKDYVRKRFIV